jgi:predicted ATPase
LIPTALLFSRYRAFSELSRIELAPVTVIIGKNGSGKSVITRLPLILGSGLDPNAESPFDLLAGGIHHANRYEDLIYQRSALPFSLGAEISDGADGWRFLTTLRHVVETHTVGVEAFELHHTTARVLKLSISRPEDIGKPDAMFSAIFGDSTTERQVHVTFRGLFPTCVQEDEAASTALLNARTLFHAALASPSYLGPFRSEHGALTHTPSQGVKDLGPKGERALDIVGDDRLRRDGALATAVEDWFETNMQARLKLVMSADLPRIVVNDPVRKLDVDIDETGAGFAQLFPVVVQALSCKAGRLTSPLMIVEQPELHLHPGAHGYVTDLICATAKERRMQVRYICETHSEQVVMRIRRWIAKQEISPGDVKIISVAHQSSRDEPVEPFRMISIDELGNPDAWPVDVFDDAFKDLVEIREAAVSHASARAKTT